MTAAENPLIVKIDNKTQNDKTVVDPMTGADEPRKNLISENDIERTEKIQLISHKIFTS